MSNDEKLVILERIGSKKNIIKIKFSKNIKSVQSLNYLVAALSKCFQYGFSRIIVDMGYIEMPHNDFTATLIEATSKVRKKNGDIKLINLSESAKLLMAGFSAYSFLSIET